MIKRPEGRDEVIAVVIILIVGIMVYIGSQIGTMIRHQKEIIEMLDIVRIELRRIERNTDREYRQK